MGQDEALVPLPTCGAEPEVGAALPRTVAGLGVAATKATALLVAQPPRPERHIGAARSGTAAEEVEDVPAIIAAGETRRRMVALHPDLPEGDPEAVATAAIPEPGIGHVVVRILVVIPAACALGLGPPEVRRVLPEPALAAAVGAVPVTGPMTLVVPSHRQVIAVAATGIAAAHEDLSLHVETKPLGLSFLGGEPEIRLQVEATRQEAIEGRR